MGARGALARWLGAGEHELQLPRTWAPGRPSPVQIPADHTQQSRAAMREATHRAAQAGVCHKGAPCACWAAARPAQALRCSDGNPTRAELPTAGADQCQPVWAAASAFLGRECPAASARVAGAASWAVQARDCPAASLPRLGLPRWHFSAWTAATAFPSHRDCPQHADQMSCQLQM